MMMGTVAPSSKVISPGSRAAAELRSRVAGALGIDSAAVELQGRICQDARSTCYSGTIAGQRFYAKTLTADPYPIDVVEPWHGVFATQPPDRAAGQQVELEWIAGHRAASAAGLNTVPLGLGRSRSASTVVWEEVPGASVEKLAQGSLWLDPASNACEYALVHAGRWLRKLHDGTTRDSEPVDLGLMAKQIESAMDESGSSSPYAKQARARLASAVHNLSSTTMAMPMAMNHGNFTLTNLLWDHQNRRLQVTDFGNTVSSSILLDLATIAFSLRKQLLYPQVPTAVIRRAEKAFWRGYGPLADDVRVFIHAVAVSRIAYYYLPRLAVHRQRKGWLAGIAGTMYRRFLESRMVARCLE